LAKILIKLCGLLFWATLYNCIFYGTRTVRVRYSGRERTLYGLTLMLLARRYALENCRCIFQVSGWRQTRGGLRSTRAGQRWRSVLSTPATQGRMSVWPRAPEAGELHQPSSVSSLKARWSRLSNSIMSRNRLV